MTALDPRVEIMLSTLHGRAWPHAFDATDQERMQRRMAEALFAADAARPELSEEDRARAIETLRAATFSTSANEYATRSLLGRAFDALLTEFTITRRAET